MGMTTSATMTMPMPTAPSASPQPSALDSIPMPRPGPQPPKPTTSAIRRISSGLTASGKIVAPPKAPAAKTPSTESKLAKKPKAAAASRATGHKRKRTKGQTGDDSDGSSSDLSDFPQQEPAPVEATPAAPLTMTKSGRQVQKPTTYNPAAMDAGTRKRTHYGKRTAEQALCKKCTRMQSPANNQMVFCDGCNDGWHQMCHDPWIEDAVVRDGNRNWYCATCVEKRARQLAKRQKVEVKAPVGPPPRESWASKTPQQRRAYLMSLPSQDLVNLITISLELHPDLPIFPGTAEPLSAGSAQGAGPPRSLFAGTTIEGLFPRAEANPTGQMNFIRKTPSTSGTAKGRSGTGNVAKHQSQSEDYQDNAGEEEEEYDPLAALWPKPGKGLYSRLPPEDSERMVDDGDFESFSVIVYDERGRKVEENGMKV